MPVCAREREIGAINDDDGEKKVEILEQSRKNDHTSSNSFAAAETKARANKWVCLIEISRVAVSCQCSISVQSFTGNSGFVCLCSVGTDLWPVINFGS